MTDSPWQNARDEAGAPSAIRPAAPKARCTSWAPHGCLQCKNVSIPQPGDWTPSYEGQEWSRHHAIGYIRRTQQHLLSFCMLNAGWDLCQTDLYCGHFQYYRELNPPSLSDEIFGIYWQREAQIVGDENTKLKALLTKARQKSAKRLARIKKLEAKP